MERKNKIILATIFVASIISLSILLNAPLHKEIIQTKFIAGERSGFDLERGRLNFGSIAPGAFVERQITIENTYEHSIITKIKSSGAISPYIIVSENNFVLTPGESRNITFSCSPERGIEFGEYPGEIEIIFNKA